MTRSTRDLQLSRRRGVKPDRRRDLLRLLREGHSTSQADIVGALRDLGHDTTQATVSRDLKEVGAVKVRSNGEFVYRLPDAVPHSVGGDLMARELTRTLAQF